MYDICVIGGSSIDITTYLKEQKSNVYFGGKGANQAVAGSRAGAKVCFITKIGDDDYGQMILENLKENNVTTFADVVKNCKSDYSKVEIDENGDNSIFRSRNAIDNFTTNDIDKNIDVIKQSKYIIIQLKMPIEVSKCIIDTCYKLNKEIILTPCNPDKLSILDEKNLEYLNKVKYITANEKESKILFNTESAFDSVKLAPNKLIATLGGDGLVYNNGKENKTIPPCKVDNVIDTTGAGDTFCGNLVANLAFGMQLDEAIKRAVFASAYKIQQKSAQAGMPTKEQLDNYIKEYNNN